MLWYVLERYVSCDLGISHLEENPESSPAPPIEHIHFTKQVYNEKFLFFTLTYSYYTICINYAGAPWDKSYCKIFTYLTF